MRQSVTQATVMGSAFGGLYAGYLRWGEPTVARVRAWAAFWRDWWRTGRAFRAEQTMSGWAVRETLRLVQHPAYAAAVAGVVETAHTTGFNRPEAWVKLSHTLHERTDWAENSWRHLNAMMVADRIVRAQGVVVSNPDLNLMVELAYTRLRLL